MNRKTDQPSGDYREWLISRLRDPGYAAEYLNAVIEDGADAGVLLVAPRHVADAHGLSHLAEESGLNRQGLYRLLSKDGNLRLKSLVQLLNALGFQFAVKAKAA